MCVLSACCYCVVFNCGCFVLGGLLLVTRLLLLAVLLNNTTYQDQELTPDLKANQVTAAIVVFGCITPIMLLCVVFTENYDCLKMFLIMEILFVVAFLSWQIFYIVRYHEDKPPYEEQFEKLKVAMMFLPALLLGLEIYTLWVAYSYYWHLRHYWIYGVDWI